MKYPTFSPLFSRRSKAKVRRRIKPALRARLAGESLEDRSMLSALALQLELSGFAPVTVLDDGPLDEAKAGPGDVGVIVFNGPVGNLTFQGNFAGSKPLFGGPAKAEVLLTNQTQSSGGGTLKISLTDRSFLLDPQFAKATLVNDFGGAVLPAGTSLTVQAFADTSNTAFGISGATVFSSGVQGPFTTGNIPPHISSTIFNLDGDFSITSVMTLTLPAGGADTSFSTLTTATPYVAPAIDIVKLTNGSDNNVAPLLLPVNSTATFSYVVKNPGTVPLAKVIVTDDNGTASNPLDDFNPTFVGGDTNGDKLLGTTETWSYTATRVVTSGLHSNLAVVVGTASDSSGAPIGATVTDMDLDRHEGMVPRPAADSSLAGYVYLDADNDGNRDIDEIGIGGVTVTLTGKDSFGVDIAPISITTGPNGAYAFANLEPGTYKISETQPATYNDGQDTPGSLGVTSAINDAFFVALGSNNHGVNYNFGELGGRLAGFVYLDKNDDGIQDFNEGGIGNVAVTLTGTDVSGAPVARSVFTEADGSYAFDDLPAGNYMIVETQPSGLLDGKETVGSLGATDVSINDKFAGITLNAGASGINYNFGERPQAGACLDAGRTATIGFWHNKNGQALIKSLNGGETSTQLGNWLAATFPNLYGGSAATNPNYLGGATNAQVAAKFLQLFKVRGMKVEAQVLAVAFAMYVTDSTTAGDAAVKYGFRVTNPGVAYDTLNVGGCGSACGVANNSTVTILQIMKHVDSKAKSGVMYADESAPVRQILLVLTNIVFTAINERGDI